MRLRPLEKHETALFKALRLRALADSPDAFAHSRADAQSQLEAHWVRLTDSVTPPSRQVMYIAEEDERPVGLVFGLVEKDNPRVARLGGMWVDPVCRGRGMGRAVTQAVISWAREQGFARLDLWVTEGNESAVTLHERTGFRDTDARDRLPSNPALQIVKMTLNLESEAKP